jgi:hypothetical protein
MSPLVLRKTYERGLALQGEKLSQDCTIEPLEGDLLYREHLRS